MLKAKFLKLNTELKIRKERLAPRPFKATIPYVVRIILQLKIEKL
jgi:hypothetical protein